MKWRHLKREQTVLVTVRKLLAQQGSARWVVYFRAITWHLGSANVSIVSLKKCLIQNASATLSPQRQRFGLSILSMCQKNASHFYDLFTIATSRSTCGVKLSNVYATLLLLLGAKRRRQIRESGYNVAIATNMQGCQMSSFRTYNRILYKKIIYINRFISTHTRNE